MSNKRNKFYPVKGFKGNTPAMKVEYQFNNEGVIIGTRRVHQERGDYVYHPTNGFKKKRQYHPHTLLNKLLMGIGLNNMYQY